MTLCAPAVGSPLQALGEAIRYRTRMSARMREIAILAVASASGSEFETYAHQRAGRAAGLSDDELSTLASGTFTAQVAAYRLCLRLLAAPGLGKTPTSRHWSAC
ncbi:carboxymuconolactone decarboxylase family protein [Amycolatopsis circi]|uniref:carboxymuconolactone decarboxylase family protein n=1 Tax=Amycolatopsis circi TaxID=871959 RepID=UPI001ABFE2F0|nr:carboxymuconolactone decarboxylase family protein [Amycolatopsis circi]